MFIRKSWLLIIGIVAILFVIFIVRTNFHNKHSNHTSEIVTEEKQLEIFEASLVEDGGFFDEVSEKLIEHGYKHILHGMIYSKEDVHIEFVLTNRAVQIEVRNEILKIFNETAVKNKLEPSIFKVKIRAE